MEFKEIKFNDANKIFTLIYSDENGDLYKFTTEEQNSFIYDLVKTASEDLTNMILNEPIENLRTKKNFTANFKIGKHERQYEFVKQFNDLEKLQETIDDLRGEVDDVNERFNKIEFDSLESYNMHKRKTFVFDFEKEKLNKVLLEDEFLRSIKGSYHGGCISFIQKTMQLSISNLYFDNNYTKINKPTIMFVDKFNKDISTKIECEYNMYFEEVLSIYGVIVLRRDNYIKIIYPDLSNMFKFTSE